MTTSLLTPTGDSLAISIESQVSEVSSLSNEELESRVIGAFMKIADALPYILELRQRFADARTRGEQILGYTGWTDFCERNLRRTPRAIQMAIRDAQPISTPCPYCDEMFASNGEMKRHKRKVHSEVIKAQAKPYIDARAVAEAARKAEEAERQQRRDEQATSTVPPSAGGATPTVPLQPSESAAVPTPSHPCPICNDGEEYHSQDKYIRHVQEAHPHISLDASKEDDKAPTESLQPSESVMRLSDMFGDDGHVEQRHGSDRFTLVLTGLTEEQVIQYSKIFPHESWTES